MPALHEVLSERSTEVIQRWQVMVKAGIVPDKLPAVEIADQLPEFLEEVIAALRHDAGLSSAVPPPEQTQTAAGHGKHRLRLGFSLDAVVREYGAFRDAIVATADAAGLILTFKESQRVFDAIITGIADAVTEYTNQRDAELQRQHNEHIAFLAHELRNPLATATAALELLRGRIPPDLKANVALRRSLIRMHVLIDHALQTARTASGVDLHPEPTRLGELLEHVELAAAPDAEIQGVALHVAADPDLEIAVDVDLISSALNNLVRNAVIYSCRGGTVEVRARGDAQRVTIEVADSCGGLPDGMVEAAFAPFARGDRQQPGFGLGLAIAKQAVDAHGGSIRIQNVPGTGCIFVVELPRRLERRDDSEETSGKPARSDASARL
jgi:signal transduction histidine kinase